MLYPVKKEFALIGSSPSQSPSPLIHRELGKVKGIDVSYRLLSITGEALPALFESKLKQLDGFNVTMPHKTAIMPLLDDVSPRAARCGAVNTVGFFNGRSVGANTDCEGFVRAARAAHIAIDGSVMIAGCGGVARAFACECLDAGASVTLAVRESSTAKAQALQRELKDKTGRPVALTSLTEAAGAYDLLINATPMGMAPLLNASPFSPALVKQAEAVFDAVYYPLKTRLLQDAAAAGTAYVNGLPMLVWQAAAAEELWCATVYTEEEVSRVTALAEKELKAR